jgi:hypothetical protein
MEERCSLVGQPLGLAKARRGWVLLYDVLRASTLSVARSIVQWQSTICLSDEISSDSSSSWPGALQS